MKASLLAEFCDVFCESGYFDFEQSRRILNSAKDLGLRLRIHADQLSNSGAAKLAAELKAAILNGVDLVPALTNKMVTHGRLNVAKAIQLIVPPAN